MAIQRIIAVVISGGLLLLPEPGAGAPQADEERYALLWLVSTLVLLVLAVWNGLLTSLASALGISYSPSALFGVAFGFVLVLWAHFSPEASRVSDQNKVLAQRLGCCSNTSRSSMSISSGWASRSAPEGDGLEARDPARNSEQLTPVS